MTIDQLNATLPDHLARCGVPRAILARLLEPLDETAAILEAQAWRIEDKSVLVLSGGVGSGKTIAACAEFKLHFHSFQVYAERPGDLPPDFRWRSGMFTALADFQNRSLWRDDDREFRERVMGSTLVVLDDVGTERGDGAQAIESLVSSRIAEGRKTILTTNLTPASFEERYGKRVMDRIKESGVFASVGAKSLR